MSSFSFFCLLLINKVNKSIIILEAFSSASFGKILPFVQISINNLSVVSLLGGLTKGSVMNIYETASRLAELYNADCFYIAAPAYADSEQVATILHSQSSICDAFKHARNIDIAFLSVGAISANSTMRQLGLISGDDLRTLKDAGAVGDFCATFTSASPLHSF